jgi:hypothetical protein
VDLGARAVPGLRHLAGLERGGREPAGLGFKYSTNQLFWLAAAPALSGATLRIFYSFMVPLFGGRRWTASPPPRC